VRSFLLIAAILGFANIARAADVPLHDDLDPISARDYYKPHEPIVMIVPTFGGYGTNVGGDHGGGAGFGLRMDLEALHPFWFSATGRTFFTGPIDQQSLDLHAGYEFRFYRRARLDDGTLDRARFFLRPIVGMKTFRYAISPDTLISTRAVQAQIGLDWTLLAKDRKWGSSIWRAHIVGGISPQGKGGVEAETTWGVAVHRRSLAGPFIGVYIGYFEPTSTYGGLEIGYAFEL
jgi:hypothetical protein